MTEAEYQVYLAVDIQRYADEQVKAGHWDASEALERSRKEHQQLLPEGLATRNQHIFSLVDPKTGLRVGVIWFAVDGSSHPRSAFVYDLIIHEGFRRRGYGTQALRALEGRARAMGVGVISLHVFEHNRAARAMYEKAGFRATGSRMSKLLG